MSGWQAAAPALLTLCCITHTFTPCIRFGRRRFTHDERLLFGAKRPHVPKNCTFAPDEVLVRAEVQWDHILRWINVTSNR